MRALCLLVLVLVLVAACARTPDSAVTPGVLVLDVPADATRDAITAKVANEIEILKSRVLLGRLVEEPDIKQAFGGDPEAAARALQQAIRARRRGDSTAIEISIAKIKGVDPATAAAICNRLMEQLRDYHLGASMASTEQRAMVLSEQLDELEKRAGSGAPDPKAGELRSQLLDLERERRLVHSDVRLVDPCRPR